MEGRSCYNSETLFGSCLDRPSAHVMTTRHSCRCRGRHRDQSLYLNGELKTRSFDCHIFFPGRPSRLTQLQRFRLLLPKAVVRFRKEPPAVRTEVSVVACQRPRWSLDWLSRFLSTPFQFTVHLTEIIYLLVADNACYRRYC